MSLTLTLSGKNSVLAANYYELQAINEFLKRAILRKRPRPDLLDIPFARCVVTQRAMTTMTTTWVESTR
ncbi:hypothetical protein ALC62_01944 [Cyphomyrmex costatus]|uniref:Uncharacterized protein n=1 Tax=Cyphomyrmex costatus TaxID=456900 RepID=A0A151INU7_9HYME|nr:hypothetical protein ALC62_01944 [Cyphomyrmex costatus]